MPDAFTIIEQADIRSAAIEAAATAALETLSLCQSLRTLNKAGVGAAIGPAASAALKWCEEAAAQINIIAETVRP